jgi:hypothetical protein
MVNRFGRPGGCAGGAGEGVEHACPALGGGGQVGADGAERFGSERA